MNLSGDLMAACRCPNSEVAIFSLIVKTRCSDTLPGSYPDDDDFEKLLAIMHVSDSYPDDDDFEDVLALAGELERLRQTRRCRSRVQKGARVNQTNII